MLECGGPKAGLGGGPGKVGPAGWTAVGLRTRVTVCRNTCIFQIRPG